MSNQLLIISNPISTSIASTITQSGVRQNHSSSHCVMIAPSLHCLLGKSSHAPIETARCQEGFNTFGVSTEIPAHIQTSTHGYSLPLHVYQGTKKAVPFETGYFYHTPKRGQHKGHTCRYYQNRLAVVCTQSGIKTIFPFGRGRTAGIYRKDSVNFPFTKLPRNFPKVEVQVSIPPFTPAGSSSGGRSCRQQATASSSMQPTGSKRAKQTPVGAVSSKRKR